MGTVRSIEESFGARNSLISIVLKASIYAGAKGVSQVYTGLYDHCTHANAFPNDLKMYFFKKILSLF